MLLRTGWGVWPLPPTTHHLPAKKAKHRLLLSGCTPLPCQTRGIVTLTIASFINNTLREKLLNTAICEPLVSE